MEPLSIAECRRQLSVFHGAIEKVTKVSFVGKRMVTSSLGNLSFRQKVLLVTVSVGGLVLCFVSRYFQRNRRPVVNLIRGGGGNTRKTRRARHRSSYNWPELLKASSVEETTEVVNNTLADGTPLAPQQLGLMGMEALETVVAYWEDALTAYNATSGSNNNQKRLTSPEEAEFTRMLENILEGAYKLQDDAERMFVYEQSILNRDKNRLFECSKATTGNSCSSKYLLYKASSKAIATTPSEENNASASLAMRKSIVDGGATMSTSVSSGRNHLISVSTVDQDSFVSAQDTVADLEDFEDLDVEGEGFELHNQALVHLETAGIPCRVLRTEFVGCESDTDYLAKLHCLRLGFKRIMGNKNDRNWWADTGRQVLSDLMSKSEKDPKDFITAYDDMLDFLNGPEENIVIMAEELESRNVKCTNFYDVAFDYVLLDSFQDLESPPSSVAAVMRNRWLSNGFKETAMQTAIWSVIAAKRRLLKYPHGFKAKFYNLSEILLPVLAWGFFGPDEELNRIMNYFKEQVVNMVREMYDFRHVRYSTIEVLAEDVMTMARSRVEASIRQATLRDAKYL